ncbi:MAG TPA: hypothetical protein VFE17_11470 [Candidatus Baltobacteraceae bacterium]|nr:hypothetical protein [Candidatus Baltobacteraceae bacterium]
MATLLLAGCAANSRPVPGNVRFTWNIALPKPLPAANAAVPQIVAIKFSAPVIRRGTDWRGRVVTSTNVASVEVRSSLFSVDVPRRHFGDFSFVLHVLDVPPIFVRAYRLRVIARNTAGVQTEEDLPIRIQ